MRKAERRFILRLKNEFADDARRAGVREMRLDKPTIVLILLLVCVCLTSLAGQSGGQTGEGSGDSGMMIDGAPVRAVADRMEYERRGPIHRA